MKEAVFPGDKVRGACRVPPTEPPQPPALRIWIRYPHPPPTLRGRALSVPVEPPGWRAPQGAGRFPDGKENRVCLFPLESVQAEQCQRLGWGTKGIRQGPQRTVCRILAIRHQNMLLLATSTPIWQMQFLDRTLFFSLGWMCKVPQVRRERLGQMARPEAGERLLGSPGLQQGHRPHGWFPGHSGLGDESGEPLQHYLPGLN